MKKLLSILETAALLAGCIPALPETSPVTVIDFTDGNHAFFSVETTAGNADACEPPLSSAMAAMHFAWTCIPRCPTSR